MRILLSTIQLPATTRVENAVWEAGEEPGSKLYPLLYRKEAGTNFS
jgi:hypothetical protein